MKKSGCIKTIKKTLTFLGIFFALLLKAKSAYALEVNYPSVFGFVINASTNIAQYGCYLFGLVTNLAIVIAVLSIVFGGITFLVSYGTGKFTTEGKNWMKAGLTGLVLTVSAFLIAQTINPSLVTCKVSVLSIAITPVTNPSSSNSTPPPVGLNIKSYNEIPIGTLTENLLAGTNSCYEFDKNGDPIDNPLSASSSGSTGSSASTITDDSGNSYSNSDWYIPSYINHDRVDCLMKYAEAAQKKYQLLAEIADQTSKQIMDCSGLKTVKPVSAFSSSYCYETRNGTVCTSPIYGSYGNYWTYGSWGQPIGMISYPTASTPFDLGYCTPIVSNVANNGPGVLMPDRKCINVPGAALYNCPTGTTCDMTSNRCKTIAGENSSCKQDGDCGSAFNGNYCQKAVCMSSSGNTNGNTATCSANGFDCQNSCSGGTCSDNSGPCQTKDPDKVGYCHSSPSASSGTCKFVTNQLANSTACLMPDNTYGVCDGSGPFIVGYPSRCGIVNGSCAIYDGLLGTGTCINGSSSSGSASSSSLNWCQRSNPNPTNSSSCIGGGPCPPGQSCSMGGQCLPIYISTSDCTPTGDPSRPGYFQDPNCPSISNFWKDPCKTGAHATCNAATISWYCALAYDNNATDGTKCVTTGVNNTNESGVCQSGSCVLPCKTDNPGDVTYCAAGTCPKKAVSTNCQTTDPTSPGYCGSNTASCVGGYNGSIGTCQSDPSKKNEIGYCSGNCTSPGNCQTTNPTGGGYCTNNNSTCRNGSGACQENDPNGAGFCETNTPASCGPISNQTCETNDSQGIGYCDGTCSPPGNYSSCTDTCYNSQYWSCLQSCNGSTDPNCAYNCGKNNPIAGNCPNLPQVNPNETCQTTNKTRSDYCDGYCFGTVCKHVSCQTSFKDHQGYCSGICRGSGSCQTNDSGADGYCSAASAGTCNTDYTCQTKNSNQPGYCTGACVSGKNCQTSNPFDYSYCSSGSCYTSDPLMLTTPGAGSVLTKCQTTNKNANSYCTGRCTDNKAQCQTTYPSQAGYCTSTTGNLPATCVFSNAPCQNTDETMPGYCTGKCLDYLGSTNPGCSQAGGTPTNIVKKTGSGLGSGSGNGTITDIGNCQTNGASSPGYCQATCKNMSQPQKNESLNCQDTDPTSGYYCAGTCINSNGKTYCQIKNNYCQTTNSKKPGFCNGTCMNGPGDCQTANTQGSGYCQGHGTCGPNIFCVIGAFNTRTLSGNCQINQPNSPGYCGSTQFNIVGQCVNESSLSTCQTSDSGQAGYCDGKCTWNSGNEQNIQSTGSGNSGSCQTSDSSKPFYCAVGGCLFAKPQQSTASQSASASQTTTPTTPTNNGVCNGMLFNHTNSYVPTVPQITPSCQTSSPLEPNYCDGTCEFTTINACQTSVPGQPGYCSGACSLGVCQTDHPGQGGYCFLENNTATCTRPHGQPAGAWGDAPCQTSHSDQPGFCTGMCTNGPGDCQTNSPTAGGYCVSAVANCSDSSGPCQTKYPGQPGYCSDDAHKNLYNTATCADNGPCQGINSAGINGNQPGSPNKKGYCSGICKDNGPCQTTDYTKPGYCSNVGSPADSGFDSGGFCANTSKYISNGGTGMSNYSGCGSGGCNITSICNTTDSQSDGYCTGACTGGWGPGGLGSCQTSAPGQPGYCTGKCANATRNLACQTDDPSVPNYCVGGTCADTTTPACQTFNSASPGFCSGGTCNKYVSQCQTDDPSSPGYCNSQPSCDTGVSGQISVSPLDGSLGYVGVTGLCQTIDWNKPGRCAGKCSDGLGACQNTDPNSPGYCSYGVDHPAACYFGTNSAITSADNCQTSQPGKPGYCRNGTCVDGEGPCQTVDSSYFGYCKTNATCSTDKGACQTGDPNKPGYCNSNPTSSSGTNTCQQKDPDKPGYCKNGRCNGNNCVNNAVCNTSVITQTVFGTYVSSSSAQTVDPTQSNYCAGPVDASGYCANNLIYWTQYSYNFYNNVCPTTKTYVNPCLCQTGNSKGASYCSNNNGTVAAVCSDNLGPCQTSDPKAPGYCVNGTCSNNEACKCQTTDATKPGFCSGSCSGSSSAGSSGNETTTLKPGYCDNTVCLDKAPTCQTDNPESEGYCTGKCNGTTCVYDLSKYNGISEFGGGSPATKDITINGKTVTLINKTNWKQSSIAGQLGYFTNVITNIDKNIRVDEVALDQAKTTLNQCYAPTTYVDLIKSYQNLDKKKAVCQSTWSGEADFCASTSNMCSDNIGDCQDTDSNGAGFCKGKCINNLAPCQTDSPGYAGYCQATCADNVAKCQDTTSNLNGYCSNGKCADNKAACQTEDSSKDGYCGASCSSNDPCQNTDPNGKGYCLGSCNGNGPCQTTDNTKSGFCVNQATCVQNLGQCQTTDNTKPGYCNGVCNNMTDAVWLNPSTVYPPATCQTNDVSNAGYCTGRCNNATNFCQTADWTKPGYCMSFSGGGCNTNNAVCQTKDENAPGYCQGVCTNMQNNYCTNINSATCNDNGPCQTSCSNGTCADNGPCQTSSPNSKGFCASYGYCNGGSCVTNSEPAADTSKYCAGFSYDSYASDCFAQCQKKYPDSTSSDFKNCTSSCNSSCSSSCTQRYNYNSEEYNNCQAQCTNAQCLANNAKACSLCQNGSNEYAGYADCLNPECQSDSDCSSYNDSGSNSCPSGSCMGSDGVCSAGACGSGSSGSSSNPQTATCNNGICGIKCKSDAGCPKGERSCINGICYKQCAKDDDCSNGKMCTNGVCVRKYSSSYLYDNIQKEKCANPYIAASSGSTCYSSSGASCQQTCPETAKCPTASSCPNCPCGQQSATFVVPAKSDICNSGNEGASHKVTIPIASQLVNGTCNKVIYNKDPLTFYCQSNWFNDPSRDGLSALPLGSANNCGKDKEIPVGQSVDDAENWANNLNLHVSTFVDSLLATSGTRSASCTWNTGHMPDWTSPKGLNCLSAVWNQSISVKNNYIDLYKFSVQDSRSDPLKELTYSRQLIDTYSKINTNVNQQTKLLNCTRAEDEAIPSIVNGATTFMDQVTKGYCYGKKLGQLYSSCKLPGGSLTDNWFFCEPQSNNQ